MVYSLYVDDIAVYSLTFMDNAAKTEVIADTYGMLFKHGYPQFVNRGSARAFRIYVIDNWWRSTEMTGLFKCVGHKLSW